MELTQLRYFEAVAEAESVTAAAARLLVSPSAVSRAVGLLERELGVPLFAREGRVVRLNAFGAAFAASTRTLLTGLDRAVDAVREMAGTETGTVKLGFLTSLGASAVPAMIRRHRAHYPQVTYQLCQGSGRDVVADLADGHTDLCLSVEGVFPHPHVEWSPLYTEQLVLVVWAGHRFAERRTVDVDELADQSFVALSNDYTLRRVIDDAFRRQGRDAPRVVFEGADVATVRGLVAAEIGIGVVPANPEGPIDGAVREVAVRGIKLERTIALGRLRERYLPPAASAFRAGVIDQYSASPAAARTSARVDR